jgi:hypothetical protein
MRTATLPPYTHCPRLEPRGSASETRGKAVVSISWPRVTGTRFSVPPTRVGRGLDRVRNHGVLSRPEL